jgi:hypothetical protein
MVTISTADPDCAGTKITVEIRCKPETINPDELFIRHHAIAARRQPPIHAFQTEGSINVMVLLVVHIVIAIFGH